MKIALTKITVRSLVEDYHDDGEGGVRGYGGKLDIRPPFQREFVYKDKQRDAVIETINNGFPLNVMYWAVRQDGTYEVIDGQQRTISAAQYVSGDYSLDGRYFHNLQDDEQERILNYPLQVYVCEGSASEKRSGRREGYPSRPPTPPCVRFRTRRFKCSAADPGVESEGSGVPTPQASDCSRPHACARPPRSTRRLARWRWPCAHAQPRVPVRPFGLHTFQGCSQVLSPQHLLQQRLGLWSDRVRARRCRLTHESRLMATSGRRLPGSLGRLSSHDCASVSTRDHGIGPGSLVRASGRCDDPSALC